MQPRCLTYATAVLASLLCLASPRAETSDEVEGGRVTGDAGHLTEMGTGGSARSRVADWMILPAGSYELGARFSFLTSATGMGEPIRFTDVSFLKPVVRASLGGRAELAAGVSLLPVQPVEGDELVWQGAFVEGRIGFASRFAAFTRLAGGPMLGGDEYWGASVVGLRGRKSIDRTVSFEGVLGAAGTALQEYAGGGPAWLAEAVIGGDVLLRTPHGEFGTFLSMEYRFPVAKSDMLEPANGVDVGVGAVYGVVDDWDLYASLSFLDRGDESVPASTLPILDGGFDQRQITFGLSRRFVDDDGPPAPMPIAY